MSNVHRRGRRQDFEKADRFNLICCNRKACTWEKLYFVFPALCMLFL